MNKNLQRVLLVLVAGAMFAGSAFAQGGEVKAKGEVYPIAGEIAKPADNGANKLDYENWKYPVDAALTVGTSINRYVSFLFQDSIVRWVPDPSSGGTTYFYPWHSVGAAFDPTDVNFEVVDDGIRLDRWHGYDIDSLYFPYIYVRYTDSFDFGAGNVEIVDTLQVEFFDYQDLEFRSFTNSNNQAEIFAKPDDWVPAKLQNATSRQIIKIPLTSADSTPPPNAQGWQSRGRTIGLPSLLSIPQDAQLQGRRVAGFQVTFKTMMPYEYGDTMETRDGSVPSKRLNYFGHLMYLNEGTEVLQTEYYNNSHWVPSEIRYGGSVNGWENSIPGNAYFDDRYFYYAIHVTNATIGVDELNENMSVSVYPNPVSKSQTLTVDFALVNADNVNIEMYDLLGNKVKNVASGYYTSGTHKVDVSINDLPAGVYVYSIQAGNVKTSKKITITE